ncbi:hypothetical protein Back11_31690 [Paenibacillus baekrokdamisoli]|uniref:DUF1854 domain-containing protein n=1 Tax=Paenibacillus baekrokdamisoli TaxID=1712516 RepID=A0A3G9JF58_9BACL|nr:DUF1854 domain-containing protein [Paenibacillus baekrokdamisoli]MBB3071667.1 hypothetical protein [Paenibacillus baekrokdamisoli]BBH21824.1 hypothetical protein Back11_31690 [Paenibacillus baekrokdamisoli]
MTELVCFHSRTSCALRLQRTSDGYLAAEVEGKRYERVRLDRMLSCLMPELFISLYACTGETIAFLRDIEAFCDESRELVRLELDRPNRIPRILQLRSMERLSAEWIWSVDTDEGNAFIVMDRLEDHIHAITSARWIITDNSGRRFDLSELEHMDHHSLQCWDNIQKHLCA